VLNRGGQGYRSNQGKSNLFSDAPGASSDDVGGKKKHKAYNKRVAPTLGPSAKNKKAQKIDVGANYAYPGPSPGKTPSNMDNRDFNKGFNPNQAQQAQQDAARRKWSSGGGNSKEAELPEEELISNLLMSRVRHAVVAQKLNWMHVFAMFDRRSEGVLNEADFSRAMTAMHLGLSHQEIKNLFVRLQNQATQMVQVNAFAKAMNTIPHQIHDVEEWGITKLLEMGNKAGSADQSNMVSKNAKVKITGLRNSPQLNGLMGIATNWDPTACRWIIQLESGDLKAIKDANLEVVTSAASSNAKGGQNSSAALYQKICGHDPSGVVAEAAFLSTLSDNTSMNEKEKKRMVALAPKNVEGYIDVRALLANEKFTGGDQTGSTATGGATPGYGAPSSASSQQGPTFRPNQGAGGAPGFKPTLNQAPGIQSRGGVGSGPGSYASSYAGSAQSSPSRRPMNINTGQAPPPPGAAAIPQTPMNQTSATMGRNSTSYGFGKETLPTGPGSEMSAMALWRLAQRLTNTGSNLTTILNLFCATPNRITLDELLEAISVLPIGISRVEIQRVFMSLCPGGKMGESLLIEKLNRAVQQQMDKHGQSPPNCPDDFDRINFVRIEPELLAQDAKGDGFVTSQQFRMILMQCEPYLTGSELDWILSVTDKDGDGNVEYGTFFWRKAPEHKYIPRWSPPQSIIHQCSIQGPVAPSLPVDYVEKCLLARLKDMLDRKNVQDLQAVMSIFPDGHEFLISPVHAQKLMFILSFLPFGLSKDEAVFLVNQVSPQGIGMFLRGSNNAEKAQMQQWAQSKLGPRMNVLKKALTDNKPPSKSVLKIFKNGPKNIKKQGFFDFFDQKIQIIYSNTDLLGGLLDQYFYINDEWFNKLPNESVLKMFKNGSKNSKNQPFFEDFWPKIPNLPSTTDLLGGLLFMTEELCNCLRIACEDLTNLDEDRCLLLAEKNFSGKINSVDFWTAVSGEPTYLTRQGRAGSMK